ncbi:hypothetical protein QE422_003264 [Chryseobacterium sp. SORGH_AS 447]|uniref:hypothetical protein n=1 Tax=Chryseobacterium sp. SORGH_AS_0447 TaxID=3041769 RepID=UPI002783BB36|nr:hypothetical protein [Chryseobacterium sp. SORGH_AS_0447]MDQ1162896.1 hypothetical protein [Chryseobacterium sp. SORGH_AS_0447]
MKYLPFEYIIYTSHLSQEEVMANLSGSVEWQKVHVFGSGSTKEYRGLVNGNHFNISRIIFKRNAFQPQIIGTVQQHATGTRVEVKMQLNTFILCFSAFWCFAVLVFLIVNIASSDRSYPSVLIPFGMLLATYLTAILSFKAETKKSKRFLEQLLDAKKVSEK